MKYPNIGRASDAYQRGKSAYQRGTRVSRLMVTNPFPADSWEHSDWSLGWFEAREQEQAEDWDE